MLGNVWEWTSDWYSGDYYQTSKKFDPQGPASGQYRTLRGGSWVYDPEDIRVSLRHWGEPGNGNGNFGFRCVWRFDGYGYLEKKRANVGKILAALDHGDFETIVALGHSMRGTAGGYGYPEMVEIGNAIMAAAERANASEIRSRVRELDQFLTSWGVA